MYCKNCGNQIAEKAVYCVHCGAATDASSPFNRQPAVQASKSNGFAIAGFVLALVGILIGWATYSVTCVLGLVFSSIGLSKSKSIGKGKGLSIAGIVISAVTIALIIIFALCYVFIFILSLQNGAAPDYRNPY
ncbi:MAG: zinc-ribbon domain-containing protein [Clostridia bacterium]|nr:zinc-ribbon domain-containing protein [Clostridia bacterium]